MDQYRPSVARWVNRWADRHPDFPLSSQAQEDFIWEAFERFWKFFTPEKLGRSQELKGILRYLKMCVNGAITDTWRKLRREQFDRQLETKDESEEHGPVEPESTPEENILNSEIWQFIRMRLKDETEHIIVYASIFLGLSPREIFTEFPGRFLNIKEVYQCKANVWARLGRDSDLRDLLRKGA
ncbi:MAG: hypothetical protein L0Z71_18110 [Anaerolineae bacterium]|nr:hypothetical protein [Anaerolineae bacterium]